MFNTPEGLKECTFYKRLSDGSVQCQACRRYCAIPEGEVGYCRVRKNIEGKLYLLVYNRTVTLTVDPIEKKPLFHFMPASHCNSVSTYGCNFRCMFCQNYHLSQEFTERMIASVPITTPEDIVEDTMVKRVEGIAYTYNEPTVFAEYALDTMRIASKHGLYNVWVSNGYMSKELAKELVGTMDAINIDLKGNADFYTKIVGNAKVEFVMENITYLHRKGVHVEVTNLIVPGHNDSVEQIKQLCEFIASISPDVPLHFTRFFPHYKMQHVAPTPHKSLHKAYDVAKSYGLHYVYIGNVAEEHSTFCPACNNLLIARTSFSAKVVGLNKDGTCVRCNYQTNIKLAIPRH